MKWKVLLLCAMLVLTPTSAPAWADTGHMVIAQIAHARLNPTAKARVAELTALLERPSGKTYSYLSAACYMDDLRSSPFYADLQSWHFITIPLIMDGSAGPKTQRKQSSSPEANVLTQTEFVINALREFKTPTDEKTMLKEAQLLAYLIHLVGDAHQPVHCVNRFTAEHPNGDFGGSRFLIDAPKKSLHSYWDAGAGLFGFEEVRRPLTTFTAKQLRDYAYDSTMAYHADIAGLKNVTCFKGLDEEDVDEWIKESFCYAQTYVYQNISAGEKVSSAYQKRAQAISSQRLVVAGYRLAALLNDIYKGKDKDKENAPAPRPEPAKQK
jgi:hypothetical protein